MLGREMLEQECSTLDDCYELIEHLTRKCNKLEAENAKLRGAINEHNKEKEHQCAMNNHDGSCNPYIARGRKCPNCPRDDRIEALKEIGNG